MLEIDNAISVKETTFNAIDGINILKFMETKEGNKSYE